MIKRDKSIEISALDLTNVILITKILPYGEVGYAMVCNFGDKVDASNLGTEDFLVEVIVDDKTEDRTVTKVYINDKVALSEEPKEGEYLIIELDSQDSNASTIVFNEEKFLNHRREINYTITQKVDIKTKGGKTFKAGINRVKNPRLVTPIIDNFKKLTYKDSSGNNMKYRLFEPKKGNNNKYPLVLFLHGSGERGSDNDIHMLANQGALVWADEKQQEKNPAYVLAPQAPVTDQLSFYWAEEPNYSTLMNLLNETINKYDIDKNRIYVVGMSNGGIGTWNIIEKNPGLFAAAVPICGIADISSLKIDGQYQTLKYYSAIKAIKDMPIWIFHAEDDPLIDVRYSRDVVREIKELGGTSIKYTEYPAGTVRPVGHFSWVPALQNKEMIDWLFSQSK